MSDATEAPPPRILFVDDDYNVLTSLHRMVRGKGWQVLLAEGGEHGLALMGKNAVDVVVSDMRMPGMDGSQFLRQVAQQYPDVVCILLTGYTDQEALRAASNCGNVFRFILKPWDARHLCASIEEGVEFSRYKVDRKQLAKAASSLENRINESFQTFEEDELLQLREKVEQLETHQAQMARGFDRMVQLFTRIVSKRDGQYGAYLYEIARQAKSLAVAMNLEGFNVNAVYMAALLKDIGEMGGDEALSYNPAHQALYANGLESYLHPLVAESMLAYGEALTPVARILRHQYERIDGSGYPDRLKGKAIPVGARVLAVVRDYYRQLDEIGGGAAGQDVALVELQVNSNFYYDTDVVDDFASMLRQQRGEVKQGAVVKKSRFPIATHELTVGMCLAQELCGASGVRLAEAGDIVDLALIGNLIQYERDNGENLMVFVRD